MDKLPLDDVCVKKDFRNKLKKNSHFASKRVFFFFLKSFYRTYCFPASELITLLSKRLLDTGHGILKMKSLELP